MSAIALRHAETEAEIAACHPVMVQLRPHLADAAELVARVARQRAAGYRILAAWRGEAPVALAGYRVEENLIHGRFVYVDDLVSAAEERRGGVGGYCGDAPPGQPDFLGPYLRAVFATIGIRSAEFIRLEGMTRGPDAVARALDTAQTWIDLRLPELVRRLD